jgi:hypothetical protein
MGMVFGRMSEEQPPYESIFKSDAFEIRKYDKMLVVETKYRNGASMDDNSGGEFRRLARYIGVFQNPENEDPNTHKPEPISMTAPVMMSHPTQPSDEREDPRTMAFVLPASKYERLEDVPKPNDKNVSLREVPSRFLAVRTFSGNISSSSTKEHLQTLLNDLESSGKWTIAPRRGTTDPQWYLAGYNPPFTISWLKTNEIMIEVAMVDQE